MIKPALPFATKKKPKHLFVTVLREKDYAAWLKKQSIAVKNLVKQTGFNPAGAQTLFIDQKTVIAGVSDDLLIYDIAPSVEAIKAHFSSDFLKSCTFELKSRGDLTQACIGWALSCYRFTAYKKAVVSPVLLWPKTVNKKRAQSIAQSIIMLKNLINTPANDMSPADIEAVARALAERNKAKISVIKGARLEKGFPLVHMVGKAAEEAPRLIDLKWGKAKDPKLTIVGKGVSFDTGGLNIKPTAYMALMKKDMGGSAHALALAKLVMDLKLPVQLRLIIPAVENAIASVAFRPGDIVKSRKGLTVENTNTDAEGRLILADALAYACEDKPNLLIDFATLTGSARAALGPDIPAAFAQHEKTGARLQHLSLKGEDPVWIMPLWKKYKKHIQSPNADLLNSSGLPGDLMYSALFLQQFVTEKTDWVHLDCFAWEHSGKPGRPRGAADTGLLASLALIEDRYA